MSGTGPAVGTGVTAGESPLAAPLARVLRGLALDAAAAETVAVLAEHGIDSMLLKGPAVAHRLYPGAEVSRPYTDVDLLVAPTAFAGAERALAARGYRPAMADARPDDLQWREHSWLVPGTTPLTIDLHRSFAGVGDAAAFWTALWATAEQLTVAGTAVPIPNGAGAALLLALHAGRPAEFAKPLKDLVRGLEVLPEQLWSDAAALARMTHSESAYAVGLRLAPAGAELARRLDLPTAATPLEWLAAHPAGPTAYSLAALAAISGRARLRHLGLRLFPSPGSMRYFSPLARHGLPGLGAAYAARLARHAVAAPRGLLHLRAAVVAARGGQAGPAVPPFAARARPRTVGRAVVRAVGERDTTAVRAGVWALRARRQVRGQLACRGLQQVALRPAPPGGASAERAVASVLRQLGASCLERSLVRQRWSGSQGVERQVVIGVSAPGAGFHAHAWLAGETSAEHHGMVELLRHPSPRERQAVSSAV